MSWFTEILDGIKASLGLGTSIVSNINDANYNPFSFNPDGSVNFSQNKLDKYLNGLDSENLKYANEWNTSLKQFYDQFALQKDAFDFNKRLSESQFEFNKDLATKQFEYNKALSERQQSLQEESYRSGSINQARQLSQLGINPASSGGTVTPMSISGGSSLGTSGVSANSVSSGSTSPSVVHTSPTNKRLLQLQMMSYLLQLRKQEHDMEVADRTLDIEQQKADTNEKSVDSQINVNESNIKLNESSIVHLNAQTQSEIARCVRQVMENKDFESYIGYLETLGLSSSMVDGMKNIDWQCALAIGLVRVIGEKAGLTLSNDGYSVVEKYKAYTSLDSSSRDNLSNGISQYLDEYPQRSDVVSELTTSDIYSLRDKSSREVYKTLVDKAVGDSYSTDIESFYKSNNDSSSFSSYVDGLNKNKYKGGMLRPNRMVIR